MMRSEESGIPGSAGTLRMTVLVSTAMTPTGVPPSRARPVITVRAQPACRRVWDGAQGLTSPCETSAQLIASLKWFRYVCRTLRCVSRQTSQP